ncbi:hypothetical protein Xhom_02670 [Xenorhabdus hominickii]|uniref:Uncharacterized protein n=1 Tax=Xenorhabdus hominickii TaxID=351679 RepID=A0A2G0Q670_XENHO|nr:hypothetical protein Xhom_02670 [Xenorhabdus hominickii]
MLKVNNYKLYSMYIRKYRILLYLALLQANSLNLHMTKLIKLADKAKCMYVYFINISIVL